MPLESLRVRCPHCDAEQLLAPGLAGHTVECRKCQRQFDLPSAASGTHVARAHAPDDAPDTPASERAIKELLRLQNDRLNRFADRLDAVHRWVMWLGILATLVVVGGLAGLVAALVRSAE